MQEYGEADQRDFEENRNECDDGGDPPANECFVPYLAKICFSDGPDIVVKDRYSCSYCFATTPNNAAAKLNTRLENQSELIQSDGVEGSKSVVDVGPSSVGGVLKLEGWRGVRSRIRVMRSSL